MSDQKVINSVFPECRAVRKMPPKKVDTISGRFLGERAMVRYKVIDARGEEHDIVIKRKNGLVVPMGAVELSPSFGVLVRVIYAHKIFGFNNGQRREKLFYEKVDDSLRGVLPDFLGAYESLGGRNVLLVMREFPEGREVNFKDLNRIIDAITDFHAKYDGKKKVVQQMELNHYTPEDYRRAQGTLRALFKYYYDENVKIYGEELVKMMADFTRRIDEEYRKVMHHQTLTHNDLTPRNVYIDDKSMMIYDWELACWQNPEHDLVEMLFLTVDDDQTNAQIRKVIRYFREQITKKTQREMSDEEFKKVMRFNALEYCVNRLAIYRSYSKKHPSGLAKRCERNARKVLEACL